MLLVVGSRWDLRWWYGNHCVGDSSSFGDYVVYFVFRLIDSEVPLSLERSSERQLPVPLASSAETNIPICSQKMFGMYVRCTYEYARCDAHATGCALSGLGGSC